MTDAVTSDTQPKPPSQPSRPTLSPHEQRLYYAMGVGTLFMGVAAKWLFQAGVGINIGLWATLVLATVCGTGYWLGTPAKGEGRYLLILAAIFAGMFALHDSNLLGYLNGFAVVVCVMLGLPHFFRGQVSNGGFAFYLGTTLTQVVTSTYAWAIIPAKFPWTFGIKTKKVNALPVLRGLILTVPVLIVFGSLLASADKNFSKLFSDLFKFNISPEYWIQLFWWSVFSAPFIWMGLRPHSPAEPTGNISKTFGFGRTEVGLVLGSVNALFAVFVAVQASYLFGGRAQVSGSTGLTYATYAQKGFSEMVWVALLSVSLLLFLYRAQRQDLGDQKFFKIFSGVTIALVSIILVSAWKRLWLYISVYGQSEERLLSQFFMVWLASVLVWFCVTVLRGKYKRFTFGAVAMGLATILILNINNPSKIIVESNLLGNHESSKRDAYYLASIGADAVPYVLKNLSVFSEEEKASVISRLADESRWRSDDWRAWNWSRSRANHLIKLYQTQP